MVQLVPAANGAQGAGARLRTPTKGSGNGVHYLQDNTINLIDGVRADADAAAAHPTSPQTSRSCSDNSSMPTPHSTGSQTCALATNPHKDWGRDTLRAIEFAFYVLNEQFGKPLPNGKKAAHDSVA